jgi:hypothetical protein
MALGHRLLDLEDTGIVHIELAQREFADHLAALRIGIGDARALTGPSIHLNHPHQPLHVDRRFGV